MAKDKISDYDGVTAGNNTDIGGISTAEGMLPSTVNNAMRELTKQLGAFADGTDGIDVLNLHDDDESASIKIQAPATVTTTTTLTLPDGAGSNGQVLTTNGSGTLSWTTTINNVSEDTTPSLGGNLDLNNSDITGTGDINITGTVTADDNLVVAGTAVNIDLDETDTTDKNTRMRSSGSGFFIQTLNDAKTAGTNRMKIDHTTGDISIYADNGSTQGFYWDASTQRLGLGTTSPGFKLTVKDSSSALAFLDSGGTAVLALDGANGDFSGSDYYQLEADGSSNFNISLAGTPRMTITSGGNVGIGKTPTSKMLEIYKGSNPGIRIQNSTTGTTNSDGFLLEQNGSNTLLVNYESGYQAFYTGGSERLRLDSSGRLGLGTTSPAQEIHGYSSGGDFSLKLESASATGTAYTYYKNADREYATGIRGSAGDSFQIIDITADTTRLAVDTNGNVGINETSPTGGRLVVAQANSVQPAIHLPTDESTIQGPNTDTQIKMGGNLILQSGGVTTIRAKDASGRIDFRTGSTPSEVGRFDASGNLLVGKTSPNSTVQGVELSPNGYGIFTSSSNHALLLNRAGTDGAIATFRKAGTTVGTISVTGSDTTYNTTSDIRLKTDINPIADATETLMAMNAVTHKWKADPDADAVIGFIAQEMAEIVPEAVSKGEGEDDMWSMDYGRITPVLVAALQDAHKKIEDLESRLAALEAN